MDVTITTVGSVS